LTPHAQAATAAPAGSAHVLIPISAPPVAGGYLVWLDLVQENILWFSSQGVAQGNFAFDVPGITP